MVGCPLVSSAIAQRLRKSLFPPTLPIATLETPLTLRPRSDRNSQKAEGGVGTANPQDRRYKEYFHPGTYVWNEPEKREACDGGQLYGRPP